MLEEKNDDRTSRGMPSHKLLLPIIFNTNGGRSQNPRGQASKKRAFVIPILIGNLFVCLEGGMGT